MESEPSAGSGRCGKDPQNREGLHQLYPLRPNHQSLTEISDLRIADLGTRKVFDVSEIRNPKSEIPNSPTIATFLKVASNA